MFLLLLVVMLLLHTVGANAHHFLQKMAKLLSFFI